MIILTIFHKINCGILVSVSVIKGWALYKVRVHHVNKLNTYKVFDKVKSQIGPK